MNRAGAVDPGTGQGVALWWTFSPSPFISITKFSLSKKTYSSYLKYCLNVTKIDTTLPYYIGCTYRLFEEMNSISLRLSFRSSVVLYM